jgi:hypothetical protein
VDQHRARTLRRLLAGTPLLDRAVTFGAGLRTSAAAARGHGGLLLVGTPQDEPWHLAAHLSDDARWAGVPELVPTLVRHRVPDGAPPHLAVGLDRLGEAGRSSTLLVVAPDDPGETLLERLADARRRGTTLFALHRGDADVAGLAHEQLDVPSGPLAGGRRPAPELVDPTQSLDVVQHLVSVVATDVSPERARGRLAALRSALGRR